MQTKPLMKPQKRKKEKILLQRQQLRNKFVWRFNGNNNTNESQPKNL